MNAYQIQVAYRITNPLQCETGPFAKGDVTEFDLLCDAMAAMVRGERAVIVFPYNKQAVEMKRSTAREVDWPLTVYGEHPHRISLNAPGGGEVVFTYAHRVIERFAGCQFDRVYIWEGCSHEDQEGVQRLWQSCCVPVSCDAPAPEPSTPEPETNPEPTPFDAIGWLARYTADFDDESEAKSDLAKALVHMVCAQRRLKGAGAGGQPE